jgi:hypothetical protein
VDYQTIIKEHHVDKFSDFDTFLKMLSMKMYILDEVGSLTLIRFVHCVLTLAACLSPLRGGGDPLFTLQCQELSEDHMHTMC